MLFERPTPQHCEDGVEQWAESEEWGTAERINCKGEAPCSSKVFASYYLGTFCFFVVFFDEKQVIDALQSLLIWKERRSNFNRGQKSGRCQEKEKRTRLNLHTCRLYQINFQPLFLSLSLFSETFSNFAFFSFFDPLFGNHTWSAYRRKRTYKSRRQSLCAWI